MKTSNLLVIFLLSIIVVVLSMSCNEIEFYEGDDLTLRFEVDTLMFDTVFTEVGTITRSVKVYNDLEDKVKINSINIASPNSYFRINVQGFNTLPIEDIIIQPQDSIYLFVEATIDPDAPVSLSPFIIEDQLLIETQSVQTIQLEAFGQNANYIPSKESAGDFTFISCNMQDWVWDDPKPYVIYGSLFIDSCSLVLPAGCQVYVHGGIADNEIGVYNDGLIIIGNSADLQSNGTLDLPVRIQTDRLEESFQDDHGQWGGILITSDSDNRLNYTDIFHSIVGVRVDSSANATINNCEIAFTSANAILGVHSTISGSNNLLHSTLSHSINLVHGGNYNFDHCTIYNESSQTHAVNINNYKCLDQFCTQALKNTFDGIFRNCIFSGFNSDEVWIDDIDFEDNSDMNYFFDHCILRTDELLDPGLQPNFFENVSMSLNSDLDDSLYLAVDSLDFHLDTLSIAIDIGLDIPSLPLDKDGNLRESGLTDIGCFEFVD